MSPVIEWGHFIQRMFSEGQWRSEGLQRPGANAWIGAPPPELAPPLPHRPTLGLGVRPPPPPFGKSCIRPMAKNRQAKKKKKKGLQQEKEKKDPHRERGALESAGPIAYATFAARLIRHCNEVTLLIGLGLIFFLKFAPISWAGAPSKACARGPCPPCPPPPLATPLLKGNPELGYQRS